MAYVELWSPMVALSVAGGVQAQSYLKVEETSVDIANNTSTVTWTASASEYSVSQYWTGARRNCAGIIVITINGTVVVNEYYPLCPASYVGHNFGVWSKSGTLTIPHNTDGTKSIAVNLNMNQGYDDYSSYGAWWHGDGNEGQNSTLTLTPISKNYIKIGSAWKNGKLYVKVSGAWKQVKKVYCKISGTWK